MAALNDLLPEELEEHNRELAALLEVIYQQPIVDQDLLDSEEQHILVRARARLIVDESALLEKQKSERPPLILFADNLSAESMQLPAPSRQSRRGTRASRMFSTLAAILVAVVLIVGTTLVLSQHLSTPGGVAQGTSPTTPPATPSPKPPTSVMLQVSASGISPTTQSELTIASGTRVTLTVLPDHPLLPFQTFTMGIYATDPYGFSELQYCQYPHTATCSYVVAYSSSEGTDYTKGKHTFRAFLGNSGGAILINSSSVTITWS